MPHLDAQEIKGGLDLMADGLGKVQVAAGYVARNVLANMMERIMLADTSTPAVMANRVINLRWRLLFFGEI
jgi:hypothetical protein